MRPYYGTYIIFFQYRTYVVRVGYFAIRWGKSTWVKSFFPSLKSPWGGADLRFISPQPDTSRSGKTTDTGLVHRVVCPFAPQLLLVLVNRPLRDGTLIWRWYTAATGGSRTHDLAIAKSGTVRTTRPPCIHLHKLIDLIILRKQTMCKSLTIKVYKSQHCICHWFSQTQTITRSQVVARIAHLTASQQTVYN